MKRKQVRKADRQPAPSKEQGIPGLWHPRSTHGTAPHPKSPAHAPWEVAGDGSSTRVPGMHMGDLDGGSIPRFGLAQP